MSCYYAILIETSDEKKESWYSFIRYDGNEDNLRHLQKQLHSIQWSLLPNLCTYQLHLDNLVSEQTARQMCKIKMHYLPHKKFDGRLKKIYFDIDNNSDGNVTKMGKIYDSLKFGRISRFFSDGGDTSDADDEYDGDEMIHTDYESISSSDSDISDAPSSEVLQQLKDFLLT